MSANPERTATPPQYIERMLARVDGQEPLSVMAQTASRLREAVREIPQDLLTQPEAPGKWSIAQVVQHLADCEWVLGFRFRKVAAEDEVTLPFFNQDAWATNLQFTNGTVDEAVDDFAALRAINLRFLEKLSPEILARSGFHPERGEESLAHMARLYAGHDLAHLDQIARVKAALGEKATT